MKKVLKIVMIAAALIFMLLLIVFPENAVIGVKNGMIISASIIIPTLFPFSVATIFAVKVDVFTFLKPAEKFFKITLGQSVEMFSVMILSFLGGYPIGAKLINELYLQKKINKTQAHYMLCFCVNGGPAFIISAVGTIMLNSKSIGIVLFASHVLSSLFIAFCCSYKLKKFEIIREEVKPIASYKSAFGDAVIAATDSIIKVCAFVTLFSAINNILFAIIKNPIIKTLMLSLEVTNAVANTENLYLIAFWLGFSGINIWCQIIAIATDCGVNIKLFIFSRLLHGTLNFLFFNAIIHIFKIKLPTISNHMDISTPQNFAITEIGVAVLVLIIFLIVCLENKNKGRKIREDLI